MKIGFAMENLHRSENELATELLQVAHRHHAEQDIFYLAQDLAGWSQRHVREIAEAGERYGLRLDPQARQPHALADRLRDASGRLVRHRPEPALLLLADLRHVHVLATGVSLDWEMLGQAAQASQDRELLAVVKRCHPDTLRQARWANAHIKEASAQALLS
jgi:hypothetical protein